MDVKSAFLYRKIEEEVYVCQPPGFEDPHFPNKVYKVDKALYGLHQAPRAWYETLLTYLLENGFHRGQIDKTLFIKRHKDDILLVQVYVDDIIFGSTKKQMSNEFETLMHDKFQMSSMGELSFLFWDFSTPMEDNKALIKDEGKLTSRPDIMFAVCACARDSPFDLEAFSDSDYAGASLDRKSTTGGCQFLGKRLISWQCKKQTIVANSTTEAEYVAAANCCGQVLWIQNQMLDYGFNFMNTKIYIDNESTICVVKNPVSHSKTKHIEIRHHFIRDSYEKKLIQVIKIHTDQNVADLLTKAFDVSRVKTAKDKHNEVSGIELRGGLSCPNLMKRHGISKDKCVMCQTPRKIKRGQDTKIPQSGGPPEKGSGPRCQDTILGDVDVQTRFEATSTSPMIHLSQEVTHLEVGKTLGDMSHHKKIYVNPSHKKKIFANIRREGKDFSGRITPLFETMMVQPTQDEGVDLGIPADSLQTPITTQPSSLDLR
ncbi:putative ribonuclease H-like domain-containing protein [Tanacetum coccineum]|uniref:Ribonuclease H-like domain-containing protein n=1 Tax=Tanacetum coccineum TaxID=301880 RepID=A0ABQ5B592_9ASTR